MRRLSVWTFGLLLLGTLGACSRSNISNNANLQTASVSNPPVFVTNPGEPDMYDDWKTGYNDKDLYKWVLVQTNDPNEVGKLTLVGSSDNNNVARVVNIFPWFSAIPNMQAFWVQISGETMSGNANITFTSKDSSGGSTNLIVPVSNTGKRTTPPPPNPCNKRPKPAWCIPD